MILLNDLEPIGGNLGENQEKLMKYFLYIISFEGCKEGYIVFQLFVCQPVLVLIP